ncbi:MAG: hypothetical protein L6R40_004171 [Gallowayella cf. fulva]|nr:MAG: hypothetical protein L6R40_004171 [Xanthomendoza cf. fulva]
MHFTQALILPCLAYLATAAALPASSSDPSAVSTREISATERSSNNGTDTGLDPTGLRPFPGNLAILHYARNELGNDRALHGYLARIIKGQSNAHSCNTKNGNVGLVNYEFTAFGRHCDTTAGTDKIEGWIRKATTFMMNAGIDGACIRLDNGGTWVGLLQVQDHFQPTQPGKCSQVGYPISW